MNNDAPSKMEMHTGWTGIKQEALDRMSDEDLLDNMTRVITENHHDFTKPTPQGYAMQLGQMAQNGYFRFIGLQGRTFDKKMGFVYKYEILRGLMEAENAKPEMISPDNPLRLDSLFLRFLDRLSKLCPGEIFIY